MAKLQIFSIILLLTVFICEQRVFTFNTTERIDIKPEVFIEFHNRIRSKVPASNMKEMYWDSNLASTAYNLSKQCKYNYPLVNECNGLHIGHASILADKLEHYMNILWCDKEKDCNVSNNIYPTLDDENEFVSRGCYRYSRIIWAKTNKLGCSVNKCKQIYNSKVECGKDGCTHLLCLYSPTGNQFHEEIYSKGNHCSNCEDGLICDKVTTKGLCRNSTELQLQQLSLYSSIQSINQFEFSLLCLCLLLNISI